MTTPYLISMDGFTIKRTKVVKYLGLVVNDALTWSQHIDYISTKIARGVGILKRTRSFLHKQSLLTLYQSMVDISDTVPLCGGSVMKLFLRGCKPCKTGQQE